MYLVYSNCNELDVKGEIELNQQYRVEKVKTIIFVNAELANEKIKLYSKNISKMLKQNKSLIIEKNKFYSGFVTDIYYSTEAIST